MRPRLFWLTGAQWVIIEPRLSTDMGGLTGILQADGTGLINPWQSRVLGW
jgi:hypothetical protein